MPSGRLFVDVPAHSGVWNMAMDEALLEAAATDGIGTVRIYRWELPTVSLGYFQKNEVHESISHLPRVRRLTGGGAILHHHEITYSCTLPASHSAAEKTEELYDVVHETIIRCLEPYGVFLSPRGITQHAEGGFHAQPFLCFGRQDARDLVRDGHKVLGSAQRRRRGAILQHGSLILRQSKFAPEFVGLQGVSPEAKLPSEQVLMQNIGEALANRLFQEDFVILSEPELQESAEQWSIDKYVHMGWGKVRGD